MPKFKPHSGMKKRVRVTNGGKKKGKLMKEQANNQHLFEHKSSRRKRRLDTDVEVAKADIARVNKMLGR